MANGNFGGGTGTETDPYIVEDIADFMNIMTTIPSGGTATTKVYYLQKNDIDLSSLTDFGGFAEGESGTKSIVYDGGGNALKNLRINRPNEDNIGLFKNGSYKSFRRTAFLNFDIVGRDRVGAFAAHRTGTLEDCYFTGSVRGRYSVGGICGYHQSGLIQRIYTTINVTGSDKVGGIVGDGGVGGMIGSGMGDIFYCYVLSDYIARTSGSTGTSFGDIYGSGSSTDGGKVARKGNFSIDTLEFRQL